MSTCTSQIIDTAIYAIIAFGLGLGWVWQEHGAAMIGSIFLGQYILKLTLAILDTPVFYWFTRKSKITKSNKK